MMKPTRTPQRVFVDGPKLHSAQEAHAWWASQGARTGPARVFRVPVTFWAGPPLRGVLGLDVPGAVAPAGESVRLDDTRLGIALADHVRRACAEQPSCALWLAMERGVTPPDDGTVMVLQVLGPAREEERGRPFVVGVQREGACLALEHMRQVHCARGPKRCARCKDAAAAPRSWALLDVCPEGPAARPTVALATPQGTRRTTYDVLKRFGSAEEARAFADEHGLPWSGTSVETP